MSTIKYFGAPAFGWAWKMSFLEIAFSCFAGAISCFNVFYLASNYFFQRAERRRKANPKKKKKFSRKNRFIVKLTRHKYGFYWICFLCPMFLSVPGGTLVVAKFYGHMKKTYWWTSFFIFLWAFILTAVYSWIG
ncbi:MAG: hypothetical protein JKY54_09305 [Flavobacteriales bacterium]|nr:hypothetical protein [Flavobacteriales bacterium]